MVFSTQQAIDIAGVKDGVIIMKDGSYRLIMQVAAINFALKSEQEQNSLVFQYQSFINSLHFPIEIVVRSRRLDLAPYLKKLGDKAQDQTNELIKMQIIDYVDFVGKLITMANIMKKSFYVVVSYSPISVQHTGLFDRFLNKSQTFDHLKISDQEFQQRTEKLMESANITASGLGGMGLHCFQLSTEEIIELFYQIYNPDEAAKERVTDAAALSAPVIVSEDEIKDEQKDKSEETAATEENQASNMIDNTEIVVEQHKQEAEMRRQESEKEAERVMRKPEDEQAAPAAKATPEAKTEPKVAVPAAVQEADLAGQTSEPAETATPSVTLAPDAATGQPAPVQPVVGPTTAPEQK